MRCLTDEFQLRRFNYLLYLLVHWPSDMVSLADHESATMQCFAQDWSECSAELRKAELEESQEDCFRKALADLNGQKACAGDCR